MRVRVAGNHTGLLPTAVLISPLREFEVIRPGDGERYLLKMPVGFGHMADSPGVDAWWVPFGNCRVLEESGADQGFSL